VRMPLVEARTVATTVLILVGLYLVMALEGSERRRSLVVGGLCGALFLVFAAVLASGALRDFFELTVPGPWAVIAILGGAGLAISGLALTDERFVPRLRDEGTPGVS
jgi:cation-transporting P-type ATPase E